MNAPKPEESNPAREIFSIGVNPRYDSLNMIGWWDQKRLAAARIIVVGAGALGNEVLKNLALVGAGQVLVVDMDHVEPSNLSRSVLFRARHEGEPKAAVAAEMAGELNPDCRFTACVGNAMLALGLETIRRADLVIGCLDNREARLWINRLCWKVGRPWIDGGIQEINGVVKVFSPESGGCYECGMTDNDYRLMQMRYRCPLLRQDDVALGKVPTSPTIASVVGGLQVQAALKLLHGLPVEMGTAWVFNGATNQSYTTRFPRRADCLSHESYGPPLSTQLSPDHSAADLFAALGFEASPLGAGAEDAEGAGDGLELDRDFLIDLKCDSCAAQRPVGRPLMSVSMPEGICGECGAAMRVEATCLIQPGTELSRRKLADFGIPVGDILRVRRGPQRWYAALDGAGCNPWTGGE